MRLLDRVTRAGKGALAHAALLCCVLITPASAEQVAAPGYFVTSAFDTSTAQVIAQSCSSLSVDPIAAARVTEDTLARLTEDGFTPENLVERMADPSAEIAALQDRFMARHDLANGASEEQVCAAGLAEIAQESGIGKLLVNLSDEKTGQ